MKVFNGTQNSFQFIIDYLGNFMTIEKGIYARFD